MVRTSERAQKRDIPVSPVRSRVSAFASKFFDSRNEAKLTAVRAESRVTRRDALKGIAAALGIGVVAAVAPNALAQEKKGPSEPATAASKEVQYETFSDPTELEPLFENAKGKFVNLKRGETKQIGDYAVRIYFDSEVGVTFRVTPEGEASHHSIVLNDALDNINILVVDAGEDNPRFKGKILIFADSAGVYLQYFNKQKRRHELTAIPLYEGKMRKGPINTGYAFDGGAIVVLNAPKDLNPGDVVCQADLAPDGSSGRSYYIYAPERSPGSTVAMR